MTPLPITIASLTLCLVVSARASARQVTLEFDTLPIESSGGNGDTWNGVDHLLYEVDGVSFALDGGVAMEVTDGAGELVPGEPWGNPLGRLICGNAPDCGTYILTLGFPVDYVRIDFDGVGTPDAGHPDDAVTFSLRAVGGAVALLARDCQQEVCDAPASLELEGFGMHQSFEISAAAFFLEEREDLGRQVAENLARIERISVRTVPEPSSLWLLALGGVRSAYRRLARRCR